MKIRLSLGGAAVLCVLLTIACSLPTVIDKADLNVASRAMVAYANPLIQQRADPYIYKHSDGYYYFTASVPEYDRIVIRRSATLAGLSTAAETTVWSKHATGAMGAHIWAPELHSIDGKWYIYFAAGAAENIWAIRIYVLENSSANPQQGTWTERGELQPAQGRFSLDSTTFVHNNVRYLVFAMQDPAANWESCLFIASMSNPWTLSSAPVRITKPDYAWERAGIPVNEGPAVLKRNGKIFIAYSAANTGPNYCMGLLTAADTSNPLNPASWTKTAIPVFATSATTSQYGPGHNSFTVAEDGVSDILVYHSRNYSAITGDPLYDPNRHTRIQKFYWNPDGTPNFGMPFADGATAVRFQSWNFLTRYINHYAFRGNISATSPGLLPDSQFLVVSGLANSAAVSLQSVNFPSYYLRHRNNEIWLDKNDGTALFKNDATFYQRTGLANGAAVTFESYNFPGTYIKHFNYQLVLGTAVTTVEKSDASFIKD